MNIMIKEVRIRNFRSLENANVKLEPLTLLVGQNNAGKTSFLRALQLVLGVNRKIITKEDIYVAPEEILPTDRKSTIDILIVPIDESYNVLPEFNDFWNERFGNAIQLTEHDAEYVPLRTTVEFNNFKNEYGVKQEFLSYWEENPNVENNVINESARVSRRIMEKIPLFFMDAQRDILNDMRTPSSYWGRLASDVGLSEEVVAEIEAALNEVNNKIVSESEVLTHIKEVLKQLNEVGSTVEDGIQISPLTRRMRDLNRGMDILFKDKGSESFPLSYHGMGTRSWATLLTFQSYVSWLSKRNHVEDESYLPVLALEEPEAHLHPHAQRQIYNQITNFEGQKIISTHSPYIVGLANLRSLRHFYKISSKTIINEVNLENVDSEGERKINREVMNTRGELLFSKAIILFEGETEEQALPLFAQYYWGCHPYELGISFVGVGGAGKYLPFIRLSHSLGIKWYILSDGEDRPLRSLNNALTQVGQESSDKNIFILEDGNNFETYIVNQYESEISDMLIEERCKGAVNAQHEASIRKESLTKPEILAELKAGKTKYGPLIAEKILSISDPSRKIPEKILDLFNEVSNELHLSRKGD
jgi:putative ATP-dependent endonuclease of the OLD family